MVRWSSISESVAAWKNLFELTLAIITHIVYNSHMPSLIYTSSRSKLSKKERARREALIKEQRAIKKELKGRNMSRMDFIDPVPTHRTTERIPSRGTGIGNATLKEQPTYTGTKMLGIGQLHKSNDVPVFAQEDAIDLARMRR
jgi:hypothetical protein